MELAISVPFDPRSTCLSDHAGGSDRSTGDDQSFFDAFPRGPAVFALFFDDAGNAQPYLSRTADLHRRLVRLLGRREPGGPPAPAPTERAADSPPGTPPRRRSIMLSLRGVTRRISYQRVGSSFEARWLLYRLNKSYYPQAYRQRLRLRPPALLKVNLRNRFPRCYPTRRPANDGSLYYGPFPSRMVAERFAAEFLDLFKIRRCVEDLNPDPSHPGCIYSQMQMCLAPCFQGCSDQEYQDELHRVTGFLDSEGQTLVRILQAEREQASEQLEFEQAAKTHRRIEKVHEVLRSKPGLVRNLSELHALVLQRGAAPKSVTFFRIVAGELRGPASLLLDENVASPVPLDQQLRDLLDTLAPPEPGCGIRDSGFAERGGQSAALLSGSRIPNPEVAETNETPETNVPPRHGSRKPPPWEHLALLARWYYSTFREGELVMLPPSRSIPHARLIRLCRKIIAGC
jgi:excinuclease ABC subunit C